MFGSLPMNTPVIVARGFAQACADENLNGIYHDEWTDVRTNFLGYG